MTDEKKTNRYDETFFLPPLKMVLCDSDAEVQQNDLMKKNPEKREIIDEKLVAKLIEKLSEKEE
jgi:hypothetical protein